MAFKATENQQKAIDGKGNILVSAAAGSGKTAVLVERVINLLTDDKRNISADELLIVTFTNAAAAEMRARIEKRMDEECRNNPDSSALLRQKHLLSNAKICTIDSFCIDLVRENFDKLGISPDFKISDGVTLKQIDEAVVYEIINRYIAEENDTFSNLVDLVGGEYDEKNLAELILSVYEFSRQLSFPEKWYDFVLESYNSGKFTSDSIWYEYAFETAEKTVLSMRDILINLIDSIVNVPVAADTFLPSLQAFANDIDYLYTAAKTRDWDVFYNELCSFKVASLPAARGGLSAYREVKALKYAFDEFKTKTVPSLFKFFYADFATINAQYMKIYPSIALFVDILKEFDRKVFEEYNNQNNFTFHNIEHLALKLLCREEDGKIVVSDDGRELLDQFAEVMVDEYQDTNDLQDNLFYVLSNFEKKLFVVGDVKQSIYAFRGANPVNFLNKKQRYIPIDDADETKPQKIILANNFRTKADVCKFINYFFKMFMTDKTGKIEYNDEEKLIPTAVYPPLPDNAVRFDIIDCKGADEKTWIYEGVQIANYIHEVMNEGEVIRVDDTTLRRAKYGDFTILLRSLTNATFIISELKKQGIPVDICLDEFAENREIATMLALLRVIDNIDSDIELLTVLMSPIFAFSTDALAEIRADKKDGSLYSAIIKAANQGNSAAKEVLRRFENYRLYSATLSLPDLISKLLYETEFLNIITAFPDGSRRKSNLLILVELAQQFSLNGKNDLSHFVKYVVGLSKSGTKSAVSRNENAVKIMTIHASKGLQFPVCILAGTSSRFNDSDAKESTCFSVKYGIGFKYFDEALKLPVSLVSRETIIKDSKNVGLEDELRLLYVALTRTQDKLLVTTAFKNLDTAIEKYKNRLLMYGGEISSSFFKTTASFADWLLPAILLHPDGAKLREAGDMLISAKDDSHFSLNIIDCDTLCTESQFNEASKAGADFEIADRIKENVKFVYPYNEILKIKSKTSVSALANKAESDKFAFEAKPSFMSDGNMSSAQRGTAMHKVMQYIGFSKADNIDTEIERLYEWQFLSENEYNSLNRKALYSFFESDLFNRIKNADLVKREMRFLTEVSANMIDKTLDSRFNDEKIIIQGAVDVCFTEKGEIVILDFKTDRVNSLDELKNAYSDQLSLYATACSKIFKMPIKEKIIYSFNLSDSISI